MPTNNDWSSFEALANVVKARRSVRGFTPEQIPQTQLERLFAAAQHAPSWCNIQPWRAVVTRPPVTDRVTHALMQEAQASPAQPDIPFPTEYPEPYLSHRRACGYALYAALGIERGDHATRRNAWLQNYKAFDAPHLAVITQDARLGQYGTLDIGVWLGIVLSLAASLGIDTCPMASIAAYPRPLRSLLSIPNDQVILMGLALGRADPAHPANDCRTDRGELAANIRFASGSI